MPSDKAIAKLHADMLSAKRVAVRPFRVNLAFLINRKETVVVTRHGKPVCVLLPWEQMIEVMQEIDLLTQKARVV